MGQQGPLDAGGVSHRPWRGDKSLCGSPVFQVRGGKSAGQAEPGWDQTQALSPGWSMPPLTLASRVRACGQRTRRPRCGLVARGRSFALAWRLRVGRGRCVPGGKFRPAPGRQGALLPRRRGGRARQVALWPRPRPAGGRRRGAAAGSRARGSGGGGGSRRGGAAAGTPGRAGAPLAERTGRGPRSPPCRRGPEARRARAEASGGRAGLWRPQRPGPGPMSGGLGLRRSPEMSGKIEKAGEARGRAPGAKAPLGLRGASRAAGPGRAALPGPQAGGAGAGAGGRGPGGRAGPGRCAPLGPRREL